MAKTPYRLIGKPVGLPKLPTEETLRSLGVDLTTTPINKTLSLDLTPQQIDRAMTAGILRPIPHIDYLDDIQ